jgi:hypothetical protein
VTVPMAAAAAPPRPVLTADARFVPIEMCTPAQATPSGVAHRLGLFDTCPGQT